MNSGTAQQFACHEFPVPSLPLLCPLHTTHPRTLCFTHKNVCDPVVEINPVRQPNVSVPRRHGLSPCSLLTANSLRISCGCTGGAVPSAPARLQPAPAPHDSIKAFQKTKGTVKALEFQSKHFLRVWCFNSCQVLLLVIMCFV